MIMEKCVFLMRSIATVIVLLLACFVMSAIGLVTLFQLRAWYSDVLLKRVGQLILVIWQVKVKLHQDAAFSSKEQVVYISNHTSTIDLFVLIALGLPNTRFFLSGHLRSTGVIAVIGYVIRVFWTVPQDYTERRKQIFQTAEQTLRKTGESVFLSPEGERVTTGKIAHFNKGSFHLAMSLQAPIIPLYIYIPRAMDPGLGLHVRPGCVEVFVKPRIETTHWNLSDLIMHKEAVRNQYIQWQKEFTQHE